MYDSQKTCDLHIHSTFSDGTDTPAKIALLAKEANLSAAVLTDHDNINGISEMQLACRKAGIETLAGIELSTRQNGKSIHILGYAKQFDSPSFSAQLHAWQVEREDRNQKIVDKLCAHGYDISKSKLEALFPKAVMTRGNIALYLVRTGQIPSTDHAFSHLIGKNNPCYVPLRHITPAEGVRFLRTFHAVPVFAHPILSGYSAAELYDLTGELVQEGLLGIEGYYSSYTRADRDLLGAIASHFGLLLTGGSDYHGEAKPSISLGTGKGHLSVPFDCYLKLKDCVDTL